MYPYKSPPGVGDYFFQYVYDAQTSPLVDGRNYDQLGIPINNGQFLSRMWSGLTTLADGLTIYDWLNRRQSASPMFLGRPVTGDRRWAQQAITPEVVYPDNNGNIRFDLRNVHQSTVGTDGGLTVYDSQLVFSGARRRENMQSDPVPAPYKYYEKPFNIVYPLTINNYASAGGVFLPPILNQILVEDYDFELWRCELELTENQQPSQFKIQLYDSNKLQRSNLPVLSNMFFHLNQFVGGNQGNPFIGSGESNHWPCPPILYPIGSAIKFDIYSLLMTPTALPATYNILFSGVRRIPC